MEEVLAELQVEIALFPGVGPRQLCYRPNHKHPTTGEFFLGQVAFVGDRAEPGECTRATVRVLLLAAPLESLLAFGSWTIWEGPTHVGSARIIGMGSNNSSKPTPLRGAA